MLCVCISVGNVKVFAIAILAALLGSAALANPLPPPELLRNRVKPKADSPLADLVVKSDAAGPTHIIVPQKLIAAEKAQADDRDTSSLSPTRSVVAGLALSLSIVGVFLMMRRQSSKARALAILLICVAAAGTVTAIAATPPQRQPPAKEAPATAKVTVEITDEGDEVILVLGKDFATAQEQAQPINNRSIPR